NGSEVPFRSLRMKYFSNPAFARWTHLPLDDQLTLRGGICGWATKAMPPSPKSARQTAFQVPTLSGSFPRTILPMLCAVAVTMLSIMNPVFGTPQGTGVGPIGGIATQTPTAKTFLYFGFC